MTETHIDTELGPEQQVVPASLYNPVPLPITAEQYTSAKSAMNLVKLTSTSTDYTVNPPVRSAHVQSNTDTSKNYVMHDTDWVVIGPNLEAVYTNTQFTSLYSAAPGNSMSFSIGPTGADSMSAQLIAYIGGAAGTLDIDWGDGSAHSTPSVVVGVNAAVTHTYAILGSYSVWVIFKVSGTTVTSQPGIFLAKPPPDYSNMGTGTNAPSGIIAPTLDPGVTPMMGVDQAQAGSGIGQYMMNMAAVDQNASLSADGGWVGTVGTLSEDELNEFNDLLKRSHPPTIAGPSSPPSSPMSPI